MGFMSAPDAPPPPPPPPPAANPPVYASSQVQGAGKAKPRNAPDIFAASKDAWSTDTIGGATGTANAQRAIKTLIGSGS